MTLDKVKVYLDGKMVVFATQTDELIASVPPGQFRIKPTDGDGFAFEDLVNNKTIAAVKDYDDVLNAAGATYGASQADVLTALNAFVGFKSGGGVGFYPSGYYVDFLPVFTSTVARPYIQDNFFGTIVEIKSDITLEESFLSVTIVGVGSGIAGIYKYNEDTTDWDLAVNIGIFNLAVTGTQYLSYTPVKLTAGIYAYGFVLENSVSINSINSTEQTLIFGRLGINAYLNRITFPQVYDGTLPATVTPTIQASATNNPLIYNKIV